MVFFSFCAKYNKILTKIYAVLDDMFCRGFSVVKHALLLGLICSILHLITLNYEKPEYRNKRYDIISFHGTPIIQKNSCIYNKIPILFAILYSFISFSEICDCMASNLSSAHDKRTNEHSVSKTL